MTLRISVNPRAGSNWRVKVLAGVAVAAILAGSNGVSAQATNTGLLPANPSLSTLATGERAPEGRMLVEADSLVYDIDDDSIAAVGGVTIYYGPYTLLADRVEVDRGTQRVSAVGNVEITDAQGNVVRGASVELTDDLREGVIQALEIVTEQRTAFQARRAQRSEGDVTVLDDGVYLPCVNCDGIEGRKPIWQIRANRIIHRQGERTITFEDASFEFLGVPIAWVPYFSTPDPTVRRKTGFLTPEVQYDDKFGVGVLQPYFYVFAPDRDVTIAPGYFTRQGPMLAAEYRQRLIDGAYRIRAAGIHQANPQEFGGTSGAREWRGSVSTDGAFVINDRWSWGWDLAVATDRSFFEDYDRPEGSGDIVNKMFLTGVDGRNRFDSHLYAFFVQQEDAPGALPQFRDLQDKQPYVHPVIDHQYYADDPVFGGEFSLTSNFTSLTRTEDDVYQFPVGGDTRLRGAAGTFTRASIDALWRRRFTDSIGQVFTPFAYFRGDIVFAAPENQVGLNKNEVSLRGMPAVGLEYSYPVLIESSIGSQVIEPIAQLIVRPNETETGDFQNEDAQSLVFDVTSLFDYDKFSGYDRIEGGTRLNVGLRYTGQFVNGMSLTGTIGQSIHLAGDNSFATSSAYDTGVDSGLSEDQSDYVASLSLNTGRGLLLNAGARLDDNGLTPNRIEAQAIGMAGPLTAALTYAFIRQQPNLGITDDRTEIQGAANLRLDERWRLFGGARFDLENENFVRSALGLAYDSEAFSVSVSYTEDKTRSTGALTDRTIYFRVGLRTLTDAGASFDALD